MALLKWLGGKSAHDHEMRADVFADRRAWGKAKLEYERALDKIESKPGNPQAPADRLKQKLDTCCQALSDQHFQNGRDLLEAGLRQDAAELLELALELCRNPAKKEQILQWLNRVHPAAPKAGAASPAEPSTAISDARTEGGEEDTETYFEVLLSMLPEELQEAYSSYGERFEQGYVALNRGEFSRAAELLEQARSERSGGGGYISLELAGAYVNLERLDEAGKLLEAFLGSHPDALPAYELLCEIHWEQQNFERARELLSGCPQALKASAAFVALYGETLRREAKLDEARHWLQEHLQKYGWNDKIALVLAAVCEQRSQSGEALALYARYLERCRGCGSRTPPEIERKYADLSLAGGSTSDEILEIYLGLASKDPDNAAAYYQNAGRIYAARGNLKEARRFEEIAERSRSGH